MAEGALKKIKWHESEERMFINHQRKLVYGTSAQMQQEFRARIFPLVYLILRNMARLPKDLVLHMLRYLHWDYVECPIWNYYLDTPMLRSVLFLVRPASLIESFVEVYSNFKTKRWKFSSKKSTSYVKEFRLVVKNGPVRTFMLATFKDQQHLEHVLEHCRRLNKKIVHIDLRDFVAATAGCGGGGNSK